MGTYRLGRKPTVHDDRTLMLARFVTEMPTLPASIDFSAACAWSMALNDQLGCCTCSAACHMVGLWRALEPQHGQQPTDDEVRALYNAVNGGVDEGAACLDVLRYWRQAGLDGEHPYAYCAVDPANREHVKAAIALFQGAYIGLALPDSVEPENPAPWTDTTRPAGSLGDHCVSLAGFDADGLTAITWGRAQRMSWEWFESYCEEIYAVLPSEWLAQDAPQGIDVTALNAELRSIGALQ
jgi:hypothetical protein